MPLDALCLSGLVRELDQTVTGGKIDKIYQPGRDEVILALRALAQGNVRLLLSANPSHPRPQLTQLTRENPDTPPMFCMLLRKHLSGARILSVAQPPLERVVTLTLEAMNELGDRVERRLVLEAIGRRSNLILLDEEGRILDCIRRVESSLGTGSAQRALLPGMFYRLPPPQAKLDPMAQDRAALEALLSAAPEEAQADQWLLDTFGGLSPLICRELAFQAGGAVDIRLNILGPEGRKRLLDRLERLLDAVRTGRFSPCLLARDGAPSDFTFFPVEQYEGRMERTPFPTFSALLEMGVIPVVNENDSVSSAEIETGRHKVLGDNDTLSAIVAELCRADLLVLLSDIDGLYDADPKTHPEAKLLHQVTELTPEILEMAGGAGSWRGTGGMATKLSAARIAMEAGCDMVITNGRRMEDLYGIAEGKDIGTRFVSGKTRN